MEFYDFVFVVLVYRNPRDLAGFLASLAKVEGRCKVVVVNSFYDEDTMHEVEELCKVENCAFLNVKNRGYGAGNNAGIAYAREKYKFRYLVISNPDIEILSLPASIFAQANDPILIGPLVQTESGKRQNPYMPAFSAFRERLMCRFAGHPREWPFFYLAVALNKAHRIFFNIFCGEKSRPVYALHGSFLLFSVKALERLEGPFDERMFLFREEDHLAREAAKRKVTRLYCPAIRVLHHEDGSMRFLNGRERRYAIDSLCVYFDLKSQQD